MSTQLIKPNYHAKKELRQYPAILTSHLVNNPYVANAIDGRELVGCVREETCVLWKYARDSPSSPPTPTISEKGGTESKKPQKREKAGNFV